ncbi:hypothetical protein ALC62_09374 [Cyphomyrmex costatus]|uniref:Uncharacterized protein n=1 Tax=Cyphomyrmex costatus TaxID=456900 RepID=A0A195CH50_9HYME|nr:hypothetical protein ALC62_09374 [Cyphomyrmex costatus]
MVDRVCSDVRYQFYSRTGILPKYRYDTYLFSREFTPVTRTSPCNPTVSRACGPLEWRLHFFKPTVAGIFYVIRGRVAQARRGNADNSLLFRKPRSTEFGPSSPSVGTWLWYTAVEETLDVGRGGFSSLKTALTFGSARHSASECCYPPPNNRPDLCIVWPEVLRVEWRDPSIEHPTTGKSTAQTGNGFSLEFRGLENTYLTNLTAIFSVKQGKIHCWVVADLTKYCREILFPLPFDCKKKTKYEFRLDNTYVTFEL